MSSIAVVTDSSADLPEELIRQHNIYVVPQILVVEGERLVEGRDISSQEVYQAMREGREISIGHPPPDDFRVVYKKMKKETTGIITVTLSTLFNPTLISAQVAGITYPKIPTEVVNSRHVSMGSGFITLVAAQARESGLNLQEIAAHAREAISRVQTYFIPQTTQYALKAGYVSKSAHMLHAPLHQVPILEVAENHVATVKFVRYGPGAWQHLIELIREQIGERPVDVAVMHADAPEAAEALADRAQTMLNVMHLYTTTLTPIIGLRTGPGTVGLALYLHEQVE